MTIHTKLRRSKLRRTMLHITRMTPGGQVSRKLTLPVKYIPLMEAPDL